MGWLTESFAEPLVGQLHDLVRQHLELKDEPLHLAIAYDPGREAGDIFLCELLGDFADNIPSPDADLFEVAYTNDVGLAMAPGRKLHLILTGPEELRVSLEQNWPRAAELGEAVRRGRFEVLHADDQGEEALGLLRDRELAR